MRRLTAYHVLVALGALPVVGLAVFAYLVSAGAVERLVHTGNDDRAIIAAAMVEREFDYWIASLQTLAGFPVLSQAVETGDEDEVRRRLRLFVTAHDRIDRAFVTDTTGLLWSDFPRAPESLGRRFDHRDWFRGVAERLAPYVSEVYTRNARPRLPVVAVAVPVSGPSTGEAAGFLVAQVDLAATSRILARVGAGKTGEVVLLDHAGSVAAHPTLDLTARLYDEYAPHLPEFPGESDARAGDPDPSSPEVSYGPTRWQYEDPFLGGAVLASAAPAGVGPYRWTVVSQQPVDAAMGPLDALARRLAAAGLLMAGVTGILLWGLGRENTRRRIAEEALVTMNRELERRVEKRTRELRQKEEELLQSQKMEAVGRLAGGVAHDFNNLLTVILGCSELLLDRGTDGEQGRREVEDIHKAGNHAADLTRQLLAFSRKQVMQPEVMNVNEAVERMRGILERVLGEDIDLFFRLAGELHPVRFDPGQIEQVIMNLAVNARDAMPDGGRLTIETANVVLDEAYVEEHPDSRPGPHVMIAVTDSGMGMDADTAHRIFEPFFTTKRLGRGTGLGLSTVYGIVRQGGGNIWVYSEPGSGTTFKVYLPRTGAEPSPPRAEPSADGHPVSGKILVVEDDPAVRAFIVRVLEEEGYRVLAAADGESARPAFETVPPVDLLLTDVVLPDVGGPLLADEFKRRTPALRVLYMSGYTDGAMLHRGMLEADAMFVEKPLRPATLLQRVRELLTGLDSDERPADS